MSESVGAPSGATAASAPTTGTPTTGSTATAANSATKASGTPSQGNGAQAIADKVDVTKQGDSASASDGADELEEIKLGSVAGKVPKALAKTIKELERGFHSKAQEAAKFQKMMSEAGTDAEFMQLAKMAKQNPAAAEKILAKLGIDPDDFSESRMARRFQLAAMSPEERRAMELEEEVKRYKETEKQREDREKAEKQARIEAQQEAHFKQELLQAWQGSGLPEHPYFVQRIAATMIAADKQGVDLSAKDAADIVKQEFEDHTRAVLGNLDAETLQKMLGDATLKKLREYDVQRVTGLSALKTGSSSQRPGEQPASKSASKEKRPLTEAEYRDWWK